ncbi:hypothetical protein Fmac_029609 [Flemingia macrophylla]|uniref:Uncharacterized protein n=1 Tax=Flemingia macrophylla TaxID=520843 RepID=A0ABD1LAS7_9FABA
MIPLEKTQNLSTRCDSKKPKLIVATQTSVEECQIGGLGITGSVRRPPVILKREVESGKMLISLTVLVFQRQQMDINFLKRGGHFRSEAASCPGGSESTSVDPVDEEIIRNKSWIVAASGITNRGRLYGVGKVGSTLRLGDTFTNFSSGRFTPESEKILQLEQQVRQSREEARQSREQNKRLQHRFQSLFNAVLPLLPSETQQLLQQQTNPHENEHDQHHRLDIMEMTISLGC